MRARDFLLGLGRRRPVPLILQQERSECGLAAVAMAAGHFGCEVGLPALRARTPASSRGSTLKDLVDIARELRLVARPLRLELDEIGKLRLPAILHWRFDHFVLLVRVRRNRVLIHDPASGKRALPIKELDRSFTGIAVELNPAREFVRSAARARVTLADFIGSFQYLGRYLGLMLALLVTAQVLAIVPAVATQLLIDEVVLGQDRAWLMRALLGMGAIMLVGILLDASRRWIGLYTGTRLGVDSTLSILHRLLSLPVSFFDNRHLGDLMSKIDSLSPIRTAVTESAVNGVVQLVVLLATLAVMFAYSGWLTAVSIGGLFLTLLLTFAVLPASRRLSAEALLHTARQNSSLLETLGSFDAVRALDLGALRLSQWQKHFFAATNAMVRQSRLSIGSSTATAAIAALEQIVFLGVGIHGILEKQVTLGVLFAFLSLRSRFGSAAAGLATVAGSLFLLRVHMDRVSDILLARPEASPQVNALCVPVRGSIEARGLRFRYAGGPWIVRDFCCSIREGEMVAIAGPSGRGKTTLLRLLSLQIAATRGRISIDGRDLKLWDARCLRRQFGIVLQNDKIFRGSITDNIAGFDPEPDIDRVRDAAQAAQIWSDIEAMPMMLNTRIGDSGSGLSGGQQQRILLARALYRKPRILFLDEATSHLDLDAEKRVLDRLAGLGVTIISVAHRPQALARADRILEL